MDQFTYKTAFHRAQRELILKFGKERLEETAFPVYFNKLPSASFVGWSRVFAAQKLLAGVPGKSVLDFGAGLGVSLPYLSRKYREVVACDLDIDITEFMVKKLKLSPIKLVNDLSKCRDYRFDAILALDVLEHVDNLQEVLRMFVSLTNKRGVWIISGPTENVLYKLMRKIARTSGKGHVRTIYDVFEAIPRHILCEKVLRLPVGIPLFLIGRFRKEILPSKVNMPNA